MTARPRIRKSSKRSRGSCRKNCRRRPKRPARSWRASRAQAPAQNAANRFRSTKEKGAFSKRALLLFVEQSVNEGVARPIAAALHPCTKTSATCGWRIGSAGRVRQQILLRDIGDVFGFRVLGEQMIERLILVRAQISRDRQPPFLGVVEDRIDVEDDAAERKDAVLAPPDRS